jgi:hypothetical protein
MSSGKSLLPIERIERMIYLMRGQKVVLAADLAALYGVTTWRLNEQVKRNQHRFPPDFVFRLTSKESKALRCQFGTSNTMSQNSLTSQIARSKTGRGGRRHLPYAFTEHGAIMAAMVLNSPRAIEMSVQVVRAFVRLREVLGSNRDLAHKFAELERKIESHDAAIRNLFEAIRQLLTPPKAPRKQIGFQVRERAAKYRARTKANRAEE